MKRVAKDSILPEGEGYEVRRVCARLHKHHIFFGDGERALSEKYGLYVYMNPEDHNLSDEGVHFERELRMKLARLAQTAFEEHFPELSFVAIFGMNFLDGKEFSHDEMFGVVVKDVPRKKACVRREAGVKNHDEMFGLEYLLRMRGRDRGPRQTRTK